MPVQHYKSKALKVAVDCILFGFDGKEMKLLLIKRGFEPKKGHWSLMGGFVGPKESVDAAASRVLTELTGLDDVYMEQLHVFGEVGRDPFERTVSIAYFSLIDIHEYEQQISQAFHAEWFPVKKLPNLIFDHRNMIELAKERLRYKAAFHPLIFELLPTRFTLPQLQLVYESLFDVELDKRNFCRKILSSGLLHRLKEKEKLSSRKGAFYYCLDKKKYEAKFNSVLNFIPNPERLRG